MLLLFNAPSRCAFLIPPSLAKIIHSDSRRLSLRIFAESEGFEPSVPFVTHAFQACALDHYANSPYYKHLALIFTPMCALLPRVCWGDHYANSPYYQYFCFDFRSNAHSCPAHTKKQTHPNSFTWNLTTNQKTEKLTLTTY